MGFRKRVPALSDGERVLWKQTAVYSLQTSMVVGKLYATTAGLVFVPGSRSARRDWEPQRILRDDIASVGIQEPGGATYAGGFERRVRVGLRNGEVRLFLTKRPEQALTEIRRALDRAEG